MLPDSSNYEEGFDDGLEMDFELEKEPSLTYAMKLNDTDGKNSFFLGKTDDEDAIRQAVLKTINTERYEYEIYSWDYGIELQDLYGMPVSYVMSELKSRITDALLADDRIESVVNFEAIATDKRTVHCSFTVITTDGSRIEMDKEITV